MSKAALLDLRRQRSLWIAAALVVLFVAVMVAVNLTAAALIVDAAVLAAGLVVYLACDFISLPPFFRLRHRPLPYTAGEAEGGSLEIIDGVPLLTLAGTNRQMGRQAGILVKDLLHVLIRDFLHFLFRDEARRRIALEKARSLEKHIPEQYLEELRGISETSGAPYEDLLIANTFTEDYRAFLCTTLAVRRSASADGEIIIGRNLDFVTAGVLQHYSMVTVYRPENGRSFAAITWPGFIGAVSGMNSSGLTSAMLISFNGDFSSGHIPSTIAFRMLLEQCETVDEAIRLLEKNPIAGPFNLMLADAAGEMSVAELAHNHFAVRAPENDALACSNRFHMGRYSSAPPDYRTCRLRKIIDRSRGKFDVETIRRAMRRVYLPFINAQCMIMLPRKRVVYLSAGKMPAAKGTFRKIELKGRLVETAR